MKIPTTLFGLISRPLSYIIPIKKKNWIFGSDCGNMYREGSKYMIEYMLKYHPDYNCTFITRNPDVKKELDNKGIPCELNFSINGIWKVLRAGVVFTTQVSADVALVYKKKGRMFLYLGHGQPYKAVFNATTNLYRQHQHVKNSVATFVWNKISSFLTYGYEFNNSKFYTSTSEFLIPYNKLYYGIEADVRILGMPRNDGLFDDIKMKSEKWLDNMDHKFIVTYMPTHRDFGKGNVCPIPFSDNKVIQQWLIDNNVVLVVKQHPNMEKKTIISNFSEAIIDITKMKFDPQVVLYHTDVLISDYSSTWIDYLLLRRPCLFYLYDDFETADTGILYDIREDPPGPICYTEEELFQQIKLIKSNYDLMKPSERIVRKYHKYSDNHSCERYFDAIVHNSYAEGQQN